MKNLISELICTRISHDIIGNIGAVANASELLEEGDLEFLDDIKSILRTSAFNLSARMKFFRMAFGIDNNNLNDFELVKTTIENYLASLGNSDYPIKLQIDTMDGKHLKTIMIMIMIMADLLIRGGKVEAAYHNSSLTCKIITENKISTDKWSGLQNLIAGDVNFCTANNAPLALLLEEYGISNVNLINDTETYCLTVTEI